MRNSPNPVHAAETPFGYFVSGDYQFARRWFAGVRFDQSERALNALQRDTGGSAILTYWPSEFSQIRGQYRHTNYAEGLTRQRDSVPVLVFDRCAWSASISRSS